MAEREKDVAREERFAAWQETRTLLYSQLLAAVDNLKPGLAHQLIDLIAKVNAAHP